MIRKIIFALVITTNLYLVMKVLKSYHYNSNSIQCYQSEDESLPYIADVIPPRGKSIFFHETSCSSSLNGKIVITSRQACAVESAAKLNPNFKVYLLYTSPGVIKNEGTESDQLLQAILSYSNVKILRIDYQTYTKDTPVEALAKEAKIVLHASDILKYVTLWKYGGVCLDLDVMVIKSLQNLPLNYAGAISSDLIGAGVISFDSVGVGHNLAKQCLTDLKYNFNENIYNSPNVITKLAKRICATENVGYMLDEECIGHFRVHSSEAFYPVHWSKRDIFFKNNSHTKVEELIKNSYAVKMWEELGHEMKLPVNADVPYISLAQKYCPKVYNQCREFF